MITLEGNGRFHYHAGRRIPSGKDVWARGVDCVADACWLASLLRAVREIGRAYAGADLKARRAGEKDPGLGGAVPSDMPVTSVGGDEPK